jgi:transcriptional regulator with XRE-family HTH domain
MDRGSLLKSLRDRKQLSQTEAARHAGISKQTLYKYENNIITNIPYDIIERLSVLYEVSPAYIMGWEDESGETTAYIYQERLSQYSPEQITRALDFLDAFQTASPEARAAVEILLKSRRSDP